MRAGEELKGGPKSSQNPFVPVGKFYGKDSQVLQRVENADTCMTSIKLNGLLGSLTVGQQHLVCAWDVTA